MPFVVSKYDDHLPLYRQAEIYAREGVGLETSTLCGWVGAMAAALAPLVEALAVEVTTSDTLHVDDTPVPVLAPGNGKPGPAGSGSMSATSGPSPARGRLWRCSGTPSTVRACPHDDAGGEHPRAHLKDFTGVIHADGCAGFNELSRRHC